MEKFRYVGLPYLPPCQTAGSGKAGGNETRIGAKNGNIIVMNSTVDGLADDSEAFRLRFVIKHPVIRRELITSQLRLLPHQGYNVGESRRTPIGRGLPGTWKETFWGHNPPIDDKQHFFEAATEFAQSISCYADFLKSITTSGGTVGLYIDVLEVRNVGDVLKPEAMVLFLSSGITLGVEFFP